MRTKVSKEEWVSNLRKGREALAERCQAWADQCLPEGVTVKYRPSLTGQADSNTMVLEAPRPRTRAALHVFLHECAHIILKHQNERPVWRQEYEAETWAIRKMAEGGFEVPPSQKKHGREYVRSKVLKALRRRAKSIDPEVLEWCGFKSLDEAQRIAQETKRTHIPFAVQSLETKAWDAPTQAVPLAVIKEISEAVKEHSTPIVDETKVVFILNEAEGVKPELWEMSEKLIEPEKPAKKKVVVPWDDFDEDNQDNGWDIPVREIND